MSQSPSHRRSSQAYSGRERRIHRVFVTKNTEYHVRRDMCVAVRDRRSGRFLRGHVALRSRLCGSLRFNGRGGLRPRDGEPNIGANLFMSAEDGRDLVTSPVLAIQRPERTVVSTYEL